MRHPENDQTLFDRILRSAPIDSELRLICASPTAGGGHVIKILRVTGNTPESGLELRASLIFDSTRTAHTYPYRILGSLTERAAQCRASLLAAFDATLYTHALRAWPLRPALCDNARVPKDENIAAFGHPTMLDNQHVIPNRPLAVARQPAPMTPWVVSVTPPLLGIELTVHSQN